MILLGYSDDAEAVVRRAQELGLAASTARWLTYGAVAAGAADEWVGVTPVSGNVILNAPEPHEGDQPHTWLRLDGGHWANTSDLVALKAERA